MNTFTLVMGNHNYSSWSMRPWLAMTHFGVPFEEVVIPLREPDTKARLAEHSPSGLVPVLRHGDRVIWDSLAIIDYVAEQAPVPAMWPADDHARAVARSVSQEMHSGFSALRTHMTMNVRASKPGKGRADGVAEDIARVTEIWRDCRERFGTGGDFLFGPFTAADAMYAPVVTRFRTYGVDLDAVSEAYAEAICALPACRTWFANAAAEPWTIPFYEDV